MNLLMQHGIEVQTSEEPFTLKTNWPPKTEEKAVTFAAGSFIVRMDQPYSRLADTMLDTQYVRSDEKVYDDTGWTLGYLKNVEFKRVANPDVLKVRMHLWAGREMPVAPANNAEALFFKQHWKDAARPRIAIMHTWLRTQDEGWWRLALESMDIPPGELLPKKICAAPEAAATPAETTRRRRSSTASRPALRCPGRKPS